MSEAPNATRLALALVCALGAATCGPREYRSPYDELLAAYPLPPTGETYPQPSLPPPPAPAHPPPPPPDAAAVAPRPSPLPPWPAAPPSPSASDKPAVAPPPAAPMPAGQHIAGDRYRRALPPFDDRTAPASRLAKLSPAACRKELRSRRLPVARDKKAAGGIADPVRIDGPLHGIKVVTAPAPSPYGLLDCRLALALDDMARLLQAHAVAEIHIGSMYRRGARIAGRNRRSQHSHGLAMDIISFRLKDGTLLKVERDWHAGIGEPSCGPGAVIHTPDKASIALRNIACEVAAANIFHHLLTPGANRAHRDHFHFDIARGANYRWLK